MKLLLKILIPTIISVAVTVTALNVPAKWFSLDYWLNQKNFGALTYTQLVGTEQLSNFPTLWNNTLASLDSEVFELTDWFATTSAAHLTSLANLATVGTITSGTWNGSTITVARGGTGSTTLSQYQVLIGNGTGNITTPVGLGTSGQFLKSNGTGSLPSWASATVDESLAYTWTGFHTFSATTSQTCSNRLSNACLFRSVAYAFPTAITGSSTVLSVDADGNLSWNFPKNTTISVDSNVSDTSLTSTTTLKTVVIPANHLSVTSSLRFTAQFRQFTISSGQCDAQVDIGTGSATTTLSFNPGASNEAFFTGTIFATSTSAQSGVTQVVKADGTAQQPIFTTAFSAYDNTATLYLAFRSKVSAGGTATCRLVGSTVERLLN